ncbi:Crp/Fnr family transcriptional regulator [Vibrio sp.]|uniref:Crp/Fnr family transcriptional regulator n=1 Tax=Vibrio viridaestus TaxID=2487322 RepID=A0A3N9TER6_9VIBR|nr:Crp/Fnr family transcriptional regulator [Vibrio viridaestus]MDC0611405.1 Crp/Fnr family transcriptional regulator [Vibrio sp.]RQW62721.1 Crp/Fnr family transcriptional regulator [Vibrio viridaestus]
MKLCKHGELELSSLDENFSHFKTRKLEKGAILSSPRDQNNSVFFLKSGRLKVYLCYGDKVLTLSILNPGDIYCTHTRAFVEALEDVEVKHCDLPSFSRQIHDRPELITTVTRVLSETLSGCINTIENLAFRDVKARFACYLLGQIRAEQEVIQLTLSIEQIAQIIGTSRQTLSTLISELHRDSIVERVERGSLKILNHQELEKIAAF